MPIPYSPSPAAARAEITALVAADGLASTARRIGVPHQTLAYFLCGASRRATGEMIARQWAELQRAERSTPRGKP